MSDLRRPTLRDVAALAGVSSKTVSRVVNDEPFVTADVTARVRAAVRALGYRRDDRASTLRRERRSATIGLVVADVANPYFSSITRIVEDASLAEAHLLMTVSSDENPRRERAIVDRLIQRRIDGLLIASARHDHRYLRRELVHGMAVVFFDRPPVRLSADCVLLDNEGGARAAVEHLLDRGHRRIGLLSEGARNAFTARQRYVGYVDTLARAGIAVDEAITRFDLVGPAHARRAAEDLLGLADPPTAFFATNNRVAVGAAGLLADRRDLGLVGFDDLEVVDTLRRSVTVIGYDTSDLANQAVELLFARLAGSRARPVRRIVPTRLIVRST